MKVNKRNIEQKGKVRHKIPMSSVWPDWSRRSRGQRAGRVVRPVFTVIWR